MGSQTFIKWAKATVLGYALAHCDPTDGAFLSLDDVYVVWYCKTLQNHKALLSTTLFDGMYFEFTYDGDQGEAYLDAYKKWENIVVPREDLK